MSARKHPNRMPAATLWWLPAFLSRYGLFTVYKKIKEGTLFNSSDLYREDILFESTKMQVCFVNEAKVEDKIAWNKSMGYPHCHVIKLIEGNT